MQSGNPAYVSLLNALTHTLQSTAGDPAAGSMAQAALYQQLNQMATAQAYQDIYRLLSWMAMGMVLCAFLLSKNKPGQGAPKGEAVH
jgi:DHA2 family multidrug resistance protein